MHFPGSTNGIMFLGKVWSDHSADTKRLQTYFDFLMKLRECKAVRQGNHEQQRVSELNVSSIQVDRK